MNPRLVAIAGPLKGTSFLLDREESLIGRQRSNHICINEMSISRRHSLIRKEAEGFKIYDLESFNGTWVNGTPIKERLLGQGDLIGIGDFSFIFLIGDEETPSVSGNVEVDDAASEVEPTVRLYMEDALYLRPESLLSSMAPAVRLMHDLNALLRISLHVNSVRSVEDLATKSLDLLFEAIPAERGAILLINEDAGGFTYLLGRHRTKETNIPVQVSRTITNMVLREGVAVLKSDLVESDHLSEIDSLRVSDIRSLLAAPMTVLDKILGVLYLDTSDPANKIDQNHLQLLMGAATVIASTLENISHMQWLQNENRRLQADMKLSHDMVGESSRMQQVYQIITKVAPADSTVLIYGETGTGKELAARAIHVNSPRANGPFIAINCAAISENLIESELFGHEKGAFTGAIAQKKGKLEVAQGGTVFLDEVGELAPALQSKLLRVLQEREFERVGGTRPIKVNIRFIAATNRNLNESVKNGSFRQDLYFRLSVLSLAMPPLRDRREDIPLLTSYFTTKFSRACKRRVNGISPKARSCLLKYDWPGNVRELENAIEHAIVLGSTDFILPEDLPESMVESCTVSEVAVTQYHEAIKEAKKQIIIKAIEQASGNHIAAAKLLGIHSNNLYRLLRTLDLKVALK